MSDQATIVTALQQLSQLIGGSLPMYLVNAAPWTQPGSAQSEEVLAQVAQDQELTLQRIGEFIIAHGGVVEPAWFPAGYTGLNDVSLEYLLSRLGKEQHTIVARSRAIAERFEEGSPVRDLIEEAAGAALGHATSFEELAGNTTVRSAT